MSKFQTPLQRAIAYFDLAVQTYPQAPEGFFPVSTYAKEKGLPLSSVRCKLDALVAKDVADLVMARGANGKPTKFYRVKEIK